MGLSHPKTRIKESKIPDKLHSMNQHVDAYNVIKSSSPLAQYQRIHGKWAVYVYHFYLQGQLADSADGSRIYFLLNL